jgi:hypothetical protein
MHAAGIRLKRLNVKKVRMYSLSLNPIAGNKEILIIPAIG